MRLKHLLLIPLVVGCAPRRALVPYVPPEITARVSAKPDELAGRIASAFMDNGLPVTSTQGSLVEAHLPRQVGWAGQYEITARALIVPSDSGTIVRLYADETMFSNTFPGGQTNRIGAGGSGRAGSTWESLVKVARTLQPDSARRTVSP